jgi:hypothetical protein
LFRAKLSGPATGHRSFQHTNRPARSIRGQRDAIFPNFKVDRRRVVLVLVVIPVPFPKSSPIFKIAIKRPKCDSSAETGKPHVFRHALPSTRNSSVFADSRLAPRRIAKVPPTCWRARNCDKRCASAG